MELSILFFEKIRYLENKKLFLGIDSENHESKKLVNLFRGYNVLRKAKAYYIKLIKNYKKNTIPDYINEVYEDDKKQDLNSKNE